MATNYELVETYMKMLVREASKYGLPRPSIGPSLPTDPCDFTSAEEIRINSAAADIPFLSEEDAAKHHARHVFGHWLCCLHCERDVEGADIADRVADFLALLLVFLPMEV